MYYYCSTECRIKYKHTRVQLTKYPPRSQKRRHFIFRNQKAILSSKDPKKNQPSQKEKCPTTLRQNSAWKPRTHPGAANEIPRSEKWWHCTDWVCIQEPEWISPLLKGTEHLCGHGHIFFSSFVFAFTLAFLFFSFFFLYLSRNLAFNQHERENGKREWRTKNIPVSF